MENVLHVAKLKDDSDKAEKDYLAANTAVSSQLRMIMELRVAFHNFEYDVNTAISKLDAKIKDIQAVYKK